MFNLASIMTDQGIHLTGILSEAIHNPLMQDRFAAMKNVNYIFNTARDLGNEIAFRKDGFVQKRAAQVLDETEKLLEKIEKTGLMKAISRGIFGDIKRLDRGGKGKSGVFKRSSDYSNPVMDRILSDGVVNG
jgi:beta-lysine 5,6-aminomutase alpha subunit